MSMQGMHVCWCVCAREGTIDSLQSPCKYNMNSGAAIVDSPTQKMSVIRAAAQLTRMEMVSKRVEESNNGIHYPVVSLATR